MMLSFLIAILPCTLPQVAPATHQSKTRKIYAIDDPQLKIPLSVEEAVIQGHRNNPETFMTRAATGSAFEAWKSLRASPPITVGLTQVQGSSPEPTLIGEPRDTILDIGHVLDTSGQRRFQAAEAKSTFRSTQLQAQENLVFLEHEIRDAYWTLAAMRAQLKIAQISLAEAKRIESLSQTQLVAGAVPKTDVLRASIEVANAEQAVTTAEAAERTAQILLNNFLARPQQSTINLTVDISDENVEVSAAEETNVKDLTAKALANRPLFLTSVEQVTAAKYALKQAEASRFPDVTFLYSRSLVQSLDTIGVNISFPLIDFGSVRHSISSAKWLREQAEATQADVQQQVTQEVSQACSDLTAAMKSAQSYKRRALEPSIQLATLAKTGYSHGATSILAVIDAESTQRNSRVTYINCLLSVYKASDAVRAAVGTSLSTTTSLSVYQPKR